VDDGDQVRATDAVYGALVVKVLKAMAPQFEEKGEAGFPDLEYTLRAMADMGETTSGFDGGEYTHIIKDYARHLFGPQSREEREARAEKIKQAYQAFYKKLPRDQKEEYADRSGVEAKSTDEDDDDMEVDDASASVPWFGEWKPQDANYKIKNFPLNGVWKKYREFIR
ncbi:12170_t:CDS:1, partial [Acaulospora colombiana]